MILSVKDLASRLDHKKNSLKDRNLAKAPKKNGRTEDDLDRNDHPSGPELYIRDTKAGTKVGDERIPSEVKIPAMVLARLDAGSQYELGELFGVSQKAISQMERGEHTTPEQESVVAGALSVIREEVVNKLSSSLDYLTPDKFANAKLGELSSAIQRLASVQESLSPIKKETGPTNVKVVIHSVDRMQVNHYETIEVGS